MSGRTSHTPLRVLVLAAALRAESLNRKLAALAAQAAARFGAIADPAEMRDFDVPLYDGDVEMTRGIPNGAREFNRRLLANDAFILASPEYNGSMGGAIKNLIDWTSRIRPQPFDTRHALLISASPSLAGGNRGLWALRMPLEHLGTRVFPDMFSLSMAHKAFAGDDIADTALRARFDRNIEAFLSLAEAARHYPCIKKAWVEFLGEPPGAGADRVDAPAPGGKPRYFFARYWEPSPRRIPWQRTSGGRTMELSGHVIIVTGGASGIGREAARALARLGANLVVADFNEAGASAVATEIAATGVKAHAFKVDVSRAEEVSALVDFAVAKLGTLNGIFNNAGIGLVKPFLEMDPASYHKVIEVDQHSVYYGMYYAARKMVALGARGTFVNTASIYGSMAAVGSFNYNAAKAAVVMMSRSGALELAPHGIRVVGVAPGFIDTPILGNDPAMKTALSKLHMHGRLIEPEAVASVVAFLFTNAARAINGTTIPVDDGFLQFK
jgi:NAD(P)-dependent dehydrogenase (short-subunit alcohol dehydrogenase family)/NAD(P)H-dependent FMN reductase